MRFQTLKTVSHYFQDPPLLVDLGTMEDLLKNLVHLTILQGQRHVKVFDDLEKVGSCIKLPVAHLPYEVVVESVLPLLCLQHLFDQRTKFSARRKNISRRAEEQQQFYKFLTHLRYSGEQRIIFSSSVIVLLICLKIHFDMATFFVFIYEWDFYRGLFRQQNT